MMERLTMKKRFEGFRPDEETTTVCIDKHLVHEVRWKERFEEYFVVDHWEKYLTGEVVDKLAHYEDLEEQGLLLKLPCKVGAKVYVLWTSYNFKTDKVEHKVIVDVFEIEMMSDLGKTVFLTKEEAEEALRKKVDE